MASRYIAAGVKTDCRTLLEKFTKTKSVRYEEFVKIWQEMKFSLIYCGRESFAELYEFIEEVLHIAKEFFLPPNPLQTRLCGLYLLYGLYYKQPTVEDDDYLVKIRLNVSEWKESLSLMDTVREENHFDALYIFNKLIAENAFHFCVMPREYGLEKGIRKYLEGGENKNEDPLPKSEIETLAQSDMFKSLDMVCKKYYSFKCALNKEDKNSPDKLLNYVSVNVASDLKKLMKPVIGVQEKDEEENEQDVDESDIGAHRKKLRQKAACFVKPARKEIDISEFRRKKSPEKSKPSTSKE